MIRIDEQTNVVKMAIPIFIEVLLFMIMGNVDTMMLSRFSDIAVAAVGNANQILNTVLIVFNVTSAATGIMVTQYLGARKNEVLNQIYAMAFGFNVLLAGAIALLLYFFQVAIFGWIHMPQELYSDTAAYLNVTLGFLFVPALFTVSSVILKSHGQTKVTMFLAIGMNLLNVVGNAVFLFGPFGLPILGVRGVAISTVVSRSFALVVMLYILIRHYRIRIKLKHYFELSKAEVLKFVKLGLPSAGEPMSYQFSQMVIFSMINLMGTTAVTTKIYVQILVWFTYLASLALAQANAIIVGHLIGAGKEDAAYRLTLRSLRYSVIITLTMSFVFILFRKPLISIFTSDPEIIAMGATILLVDIFVELGRIFNLVIINAFKSAGDVYFPVIIGIFSMWGVSTLGAYILGVHLGFGLVGIWVAMAADEILRGIIMFVRLMRGNWRGKQIVENH
ncbi:MATE family efflux transporter [Fusibacter tunisiensis]|uniref:MATE family efflux protein n=1 Tax=Fusibacter tunisiensis TaxID=1008308 RepID=A0ABS2MS80_9FIRM|nr:MATE family efflux transporter [Fusibacter tunisiensis]MBM7562281.1 putative MATE family efflux protein [Fusibacter tunisiensis]